MKKLIWLAIAIIPPVISVILAVHHRAGLGVALDVLVLAFCVLAILLILPVWGGWRNYNRADSMGFQDFIMEPFALMFTGTRNSNPLRWMVALSTIIQIVIASIPSIAGVALTQHIAVQQGWNQIKRELTGENISVIENKASIAARTTPSIRQEFAHDLDGSQVVSSKTGMFALTSTNYLIIICKDNFQVALMNHGDNGTFTVVNEGQNIRHATQYTIRSKPLEQWYKHIMAKIASSEA